MGFWDLLVYLLIIVTILFVIFCASPEGDNPLSKLNRLFFIYIPKAANRLFIRILGQERTRSIQFYSTYIFYEPNPFFQMVYLALSIGGYTIFMHFGFPMIPNQYVSEYHIYIGTFIYFLALVSYLSACLAPPGIITKKNLSSHLEVFKYDNVLHKPGDCSTCKLQRPARSKHCSICKLCVSKHDHHCIWINQCVGYSNYKFFLAFIFSHSIICTYAGLVGFFTFMDFIKVNKLLTATFTDVSGRNYESSWSVVFQYLLQQYPAFVFIVILCLLMGLVLGGFFLYHLIMAGGNSTTSERVKRLRLPNEGNDLQNPYDKGFMENLREVFNAGEY